MVDKICNYLTNKIKNKMPELDDERIEIINYGIQIIVGEIPKTFIFVLIAVILGIIKEFFITMLVVFPYRAFSGGFHLKSHIGCILGTSLFYCGIPYISRLFEIGSVNKIIISIIVWIFGMWMCKLYAPADTENVPILRKKERRIKQILAYITLTVELIIGLLINDSTISNIIILGIFAQTLLITRIAYKITNNKYGYEIHLT